MAAAPQTTSSRSRAALARRGKTKPRSKQIMSYAFSKSSRTSTLNHIPQRHFLCSWRCSGRGRASRGRQQAQSELPATDLLASLHRRPSNRQGVTYRSHQVAEITGALDPQLIRESLEKLAKTATSHDRLIIYVTAHGSPGPDDDSFDTSIDCWGSKKITAREFSHWLDKLPHDMPVVMVMAQCYCGGFRSPDLSKTSTKARGSRSRRGSVSLRNSTICPRPAAGPTSSTTKSSVAISGAPSPGIVAAAPVSPTATSTATASSRLLKPTRTP